MTATAYLSAPGTRPQESLTESGPAVAVADGFTVPVGVAEAQRPSETLDHLPPTRAWTRKECETPFARSDTV